ncbi:aldo/keto reductase [Baekduia soli]|uniref:Aldo/keto reductase n=1 Tax=Baekduia soli TaxID=496014 RepID=A0A5B8U2C2_9ACTN|nr:aldo/keto reductase [Baekduia soli]QEC47062.1 aldo/keto reductase [Baekduia soli]
MPIEPTHTALGTWSGGHFMHFGAPIEEARLLDLLRPDERIPTVITADAYGAGAADALLGRSLAGLDRDAYCLVGAVGHDFYDGEREGAKGFPRFTDPRLRGPGEYGAYLRMAAERSLQRLGADAFDVLLLHNPDRTGYTHDAVWEGMAALRDAGLTRRLGIAPGPANGFTLDVIDCFERHGALIDWAMVILNPFEPWPGELVLPAAEAHDVQVITRVTDYGGIFHDDLRPGLPLAPRDHRAFRPAGWIEAGTERLERLRPIAERHGLSTLQLAAQWNLAHPAVACVVPTLIQEAWDGAKPVEAQREDLAATPTEVVLSPEEVAEIRAIGDNTRCMALKGGVPDHEGAAVADRWTLDAELEAVGARWDIAPGALQPA